MLRSTSYEVKQKLYMRILVRFSEVFGGDQETLKIIKETLDKELSDKDYINAQVSTLLYFLILFHP